MTTGDGYARPAGDELLEVDGVEVAPPLTLIQARTLASAGLLAGDVAGLTEAWGRVEGAWGETVRRARREVPERLDEPVDGEWSFIETLRHLVFVTDGWIGAGVLGSQTLHPLGLPPHFITDGRRRGLDLDAGPDLDTVLAARRSRQEMVARALASLSQGGLGAPCLGHLSGFTRRGALQVVMAEEWFHHGFAVRDLSALGLS